MSSGFHLIGTASAHVFYQFARLQAMTDWWHWMVLLGTALAVVLYVVWMYRHDAMELSRPLAWLLTLLRVAAFAGVLFYFLDLEKRSEIQQQKNSRVLCLVDTSQSMALPQEAGPGSDSRINQVVAEFQRGQLLEELRGQHDVVVYRFDEASQPAEIAMFPRTTQVASDGTISRAAQAQWERDLSVARMTTGVAAGILAMSLLSALIYLVVPQRLAGEQTSWALLVSIVLLISGLIVFAVVNLRFPQFGVRAVVGLETPPLPGAKTPETATPLEAVAEPDVDWAATLTPQGTETRIGEAVRYIVNQERGGPIAGVVVITDGGHNAGINPAAAIQAAQQAAIPVHAVGLGSEKRPQNVRVVDLEAPRRVFPGDNFTVTGYIQGYGLAGRTVKVELFSTELENGQVPDDAGLFEDERRVQLSDDGEVVSLRFEVTPEEQGQRAYRLRVTPPAGDADANDNEKVARVQIVERQTRVLIVAGGPTREYRFLRNQLYRDRDTTVDVLLQTGTDGISQEADDVLYEFPELADELFAYDCIVAFDPDWSQLSEDQAQLLERWVAEQAGGLVVVAGPVHTPEWSRLRRGSNRAVQIVQNLYPVVFYTQGAPALSLGRFGGESAWPLQFTRDGLQAEFLWLEDEALDSEATWSAFDGVFGYYAVKDPKPGARIFARFSDPDTSIDGDLPIYLAGQFYGAGRVFFQASGEMWRMRAVDERYFERYYTKLVRWISQGRLLRDSRRGVLLTDKERCLLGEPVVVRAFLTDPQFQPLTDSEVAAILVQPDGTRQTLTLKKVQEATRDGMYSAQITARVEGDYRIELTPPQGDDGELLTRTVRVRVPAREIEQPQRNDALLTRITDLTGGAYFVGLGAARTGEGQAPLASRLEPRDHITYLAGTPDDNFDRRLMIWLMGFIVGALSLEWLIRRVSRLA